MRIYYTVYQLTNLVNGKIYIGCHMTKDVNDGYMGSGKRLFYAKKKHGLENFKKEILKICDTHEEMLAEEARLVNEEFLGRPDVYNLNLGGRGSWLACNSHPDRQARCKQGRVKADEALASKFGSEWRTILSRMGIEKQRATQRGIFSPAFVNLFLRPENLAKAMVANRTPEAIQKRKDKFAKIGHQQGEKNSQFGKVWMYDETRSLRFKREEIEQKLSEGWKLGRKMK